MPTERVFDAVRFHNADIASSRRREPRGLDDVHIPSSSQGCEWKYLDKRSAEFKTAALAAVTPTNPPPAPTNLEALCNGASQVSLRWSPAATADTYSLRINDLSKATPTPYDYVVDGLR